MFFSPPLQDSDTDLMLAASTGDLKAVKQLISSGANVEATDWVSIRIMSDLILI